MDDTQGSNPPALAETHYELLRTPYWRSSQNAQKAKFAEFIFYDVG